uniref:Uncharacterized protein n=1 Tax=Podarcis muralis TaxID=64176 RepID=A0A670ICV9_PODMU
MDSLLGRWGPHLEVLGVHMELVAVQLAQLGKGGLDVIEVLDGFSEGGHDHLAVRLDPGVAHDGGRAGEVAKLSKEPLAPGVHHQQGFGPNHGHVTFAPDLGDDLPLFIGPLHHGGWLRVG